jgi:hypothetical protein
VGSTPRWLPRARMVRAGSPLASASRNAACKNSLG